MKKIISICLFAILPLVIMEAHGWDELAILARRNSDGTFTLEKESYIPVSSYTNAVFFDYNNDGNLDLLIMASGGDRFVKKDIKMVALYRNLGPEQDYHFERVPDTGFAQRRDEQLLSPISVGDYNHDGYTDVLLMSNDGNRYVELYLNDQGSGKFICQENALFENVSGGSVTFGDLNNDGWLDIVYLGYGPANNIYMNNQDGTFTDKTPDNLLKMFEGAAALADVNGDGTLDIISTGFTSDWERHATLYYNTVENNECTYRLVSENESGLIGVNKGTPLLADLNADGRMDMVINGWANDGGNRNRIYYQTPEGKFIKDESYPVIPVNEDGGINMGDTNGDGNMDLIVGGWVGDGKPDNCYSTPLRIYENSPQRAGITGNTFPNAPTEVTVEKEENGELTISWKSGSDNETAEVALRYNIYVKNETTGELYTMIPANTETGKLKVGTDLQTSLSSAVHSYRMKVFGDGDYTIGVQTLDQAYAGSPFTTATIKLTTGIKNNEAGNSFRVITTGSSVTVEGDAGQDVAIYSVDGRIAATGISNVAIPLSLKGIYLITVNKERYKIAL